MSNYTIRHSSQSQMILYEKIQKGGQHEEIRRREELEESEEVREKAFGLKVCKWGKILG